MQEICRFDIFMNVVCIRKYRTWAKKGLHVSTYVVNPHVLKFKKLDKYIIRNSVGGVFFYFVGKVFFSARLGKNVGWVCKKVFLIFFPSVSKKNQTFQTSPSKLYQGKKTRKKNIKKKSETEFSKRNTLEVRFMQHKTTPPT